MIELNVKSIKFATRTRAQRRSAVAVIIKQLERIRDAEVDCLCKTPSSFTFTLNHRMGEEAIELINWVIDSLHHVYNVDKFDIAYQNSHCIPF